MAKQETKNGGFSDQERAAMQERARELKAEARREARGKKARIEGEMALQARIAEMPEPDKSMAARIHEIVTSAAPNLVPKTWYGMPAYARDGKVVCYFQDAAKFESRYSTFGFNDVANLDDGELWPTSFAVVELTAAAEKKITELVKKAMRDRE
jgi:uncharacterized protein YdhG (YjbR/CyaY superfamily)